MTFLERHARARDRFFATRFPEFWADVERHPYALYDVLPTAPDTIASLRAAAADAWTIFARVTPVLQALPDAELLAIGVPPPALDIVRMATDMPSVLARFDFALTSSGPKVLEINAMTPFLIWESHAIAEAVARELKHEDPNRGAEAALRDGIAATLAPFGANARIAVTALNPWREDWMTCRYLAGVIRSAGYAADCIPTSELRMRSGRLCDGTGGRIDVLWSHYPLEHFAHDAGGAAFCEAIAHGRLTLINPPAALLLQNKAALAIIWGLAENDVHFDAPERAIVGRLFLPASIEPRRVTGRHVAKPVLGREGNSVRVVENDTVVERSNHRTYERQPHVYQRFADLAEVSYTDPRYGTRTGLAVHIVFVARGKPTA